MSYSEEVLEVADAVGLLKQSGNIDRAQTAIRIKEALDSRPMNPVDDSEIFTVEELAFEVFKSDLPELRSLVAQLCTLSPDGAVQMGLNGGGILLCGKSVSRTFVDAHGITETRMKTGRFLSDQDPMVMEFLVEANAEAVAKKVGNMVKLHSLVARRRPSLAAALDQRRLATTQVVQNMLMPPSASPNGNGRKKRNP
jgi:hypothetical protein